MSGLEAKGQVAKPMEQPAIAYLWLRALFGEDEEDASDFNFLSAIKKDPVPKAPRKRKSSEGGAKGTPRDPRMVAPCGWGKGSHLGSTHLPHRRLV